MAQHLTPDRRSDGATRRPLLLAAAVGGLVLLIIAAGLLLRPPSRTGQAPEQTVWGAITAGIHDGDVPLETGLQALAYLYHVDIPGIHVPSGTPGARNDDAPTSATGAVRWVRAKQDQLTPEQLAIFTRLTQAGPNDLVIPVTGPGGEPIAAVGQVAALDGRPPAGPLPRANLGTAATVADAIRDDLFATITHIGEKLGLPVIHEGLYLKDVTLTLSEDSGLREDGSYTFWLTQPMVEAGNYSPCNVTVYKDLWSKETAGQALSATMHVTLTHEVIHCYQYAVIEESAAASVPTWIMEGSAIWLAGNDTGLVEPMTPGMWRTHILGRPQTALTSRSYDAYGWYALLDHLGRPLWSLMGDAWRAAATSAGAGRSEAYIKVLDGDAEDVTHAWAPSHAREPSWNDLWLTFGAGLPADAVAPRTPVVATGAGYLGSLPARSNALYTVTDSEGEIAIVETDGLAGAHDGAVHSELDFSSRRFCVRGDCICPPRTQRAGQYVADVDFALPFVVAFQSPAGGSGQRISSQGLEAACGEADPSPSPSKTRSSKPPVAGGNGPPRCGQRCPGSNGEPHMRTVDGVRYDFQAAGEFTLLRTADGTVELQARQEPIGRRDSVTINTALAARVNDRRVGIYATPAGLELRIDGVTQMGTGSIDLGDARVQSHPKGIELDLPDGTIVWALSGAGYGVFALVDPSRAIVETGVGLIGRSAPGLRVPRLPDGTALPAPKDRHDWYALLYGRFADAWRVTDATTLFDYGAGKSTASYTIHDYPSAPKVATFQELDPAQAAAGRQTCAAIADTELQEQCAFDVAVTGDAGYVGPYVATALVAQQGTAALDVAIPPASSPQATEPAANPPVEVLPAFHRLAGSALGPDGTLYLSVVMTDRSGRVLAIDPLTGGVLRQVNTTGAGLIAVAAGAVWVGEFGGPSTGAPPCSIARLDPTTFAVQATIPTACHRVWLRTEFAALGDAVWVVDPSTADVSGAGGTLRRIDPATNAVAESVPLPFADGVLRASATALFYGEPTKGQFRLRPGETALARIGEPDTNAFPEGYPAGDGLWAVANGRLGLYTSANGPDGTVDLDDADGGVLGGADAESVYLDRSAPGGVHELWRRYLDGRVPIRLAAAPPADTGIGPLILLYLDGAEPTFLVGETSVTKLWIVVSRTDPAESLLLVQGARLPKP